MAASWRAGGASIAAARQTTGSRFGPRSPSRKRRRGPMRGGRPPKLDAAVYAVESEVEETHWWFVGRRRLFAAELARAGVARDARILDVGAGTGSTLRMLHDAGYTRTAGLDSSDDAVRFCAAKGLGPVQKGDILALPFPDASFDFVFATDILEHVDDDGRAAAEIARILVPGGKALITVPTFQRLWGLQDRRA